MTEIPKGPDNIFSVFFTLERFHREGKHLFRRPLCVSGVSMGLHPALEHLHLMERKRIIDHRSYSSVLQECLEICSLRGPHSILVINVISPGGDGNRTGKFTVCLQSPVVLPCDLSSPLVEFVQIFELGIDYSSLECIEPRIITDMVDIVLIPAAV